MQTDLFCMSVHVFPVVLHLNATHMYTKCDHMPPYSLAILTLQVLLALTMHMLAYMHSYVKLSVCCVDSVQLKLMRASIQLQASQLNLLWFEESLKTKLPQARFEL